MQRNYVTKMFVSAAVLALFSAVRQARPESPTTAPSASPSAQPQKSLMEDRKLSEEDLRAYRRDLAEVRQNIADRSQPARERLRAQQEELHRNAAARKQENEARRRVEKKNGAVQRDLNNMMFGAPQRPVRPADRAGVASAQQNLQDELRANAIDKALAESTVNMAWGQRNAALSCCKSAWSLLLVKWKGQPEDLKHDVDGYFFLIDHLMGKKSELKISPDFLLASEIMRQLDPYYKRGLLLWRGTADRSWNYAEAVADRWLTIRKNDAASKPEDSKVMEFWSNAVAENVSAATASEPASTR